MNQNILALSERIVYLQEARKTVKWQEWQELTLELIETKRRLRLSLGMEHETISQAIKSL